MAATVSIDLDVTRILRHPPSRSFLGLGRTSKRYQHDKVNNGRGKNYGTHQRRPTDFDVYWSEVTGVCYSYGTRGVVEFRTAKRKWRVSTDEPAEAKRIVSAVGATRPGVKRTQGCS